MAKIGSCPAADVVRTLLRILGKTLRGLCIISAGFALFGLIFGLFLLQGGDPVGAGDILTPLAFFTAFTAAAIGLGRLLKKIEFDGPPPPEMTLEEYRAIEEDEKAVAAQERRQKLFKWIVVGSPLWIMGGCMGHALLDSMRGVRESSQATQCLNNMRYFETAEKEFESARHRPPRSVEEFVGFAHPVDFSCIAGGKYGLARDNAGTVVLSCSEHGWADHIIPPKHPHM